MLTGSEYRIKGSSEQYLKITAETKGGYSVVITKIESGYMEEKEEFMSSSLFESCLRTDYLIPVKQAAAKAG
jgi:hypothetical protein